MNKVFRVIWSYAQQALVVVSELTRAYGKGSVSVDKRISSGSSTALSAQKSHFNLNLVTKSILIGGLGLFLSTSMYGAVVNYRPLYGVIDDGFEVKGTAIGLNSKSLSESTIAYGVGAQTLKLSEVTSSPVATELKITNGSSIWTNDGKDSEGKSSSVLGAMARTYGQQATAIGNTAEAVVFSTATGHNAKALQYATVATGQDSRALGKWSTATGVQAKSLGEFSNAIGGKAEARKNKSIAIGTETIAEGEEGTAVGYHADVTGSDGSAIGSQALAAEKATATGAQSKAEGTKATAAGFKANASGTSSLALGENSTASVDKSVALGSESVTETPVTTLNKQIGTFNFSFDQNTAISTVSVGKDGLKRTITNVAAGRLEANSTDAINGAQLYAVASALGKEVENIYFHTNDGSGTQGAGDAETNKGKISEQAGATGNFSLAAGISAKAKSVGSVAIGHMSKVESDSGIAIGSNAVAISKGSRTASSQMVDGKPVVVNGAVAIGAGAVINAGKRANVSRGSTAIGGNSLAGLVNTGNNGTEVDFTDATFNTETGNLTVDNTNKDGNLFTLAGINTEKKDTVVNEATAIGFDSRAIGDQSIAIGAQTVAGHASVAIGGNDAGAITSAAKAKYKKIVGENAPPNKKGEFYLTTSALDGSVAIGLKAYSKSSMGTAIGTYAMVNENSALATAIGTGAKVGDETTESDAGMAVGAGAYALNNYTTALGTGAKAIKTSATAVGYLAKATENKATAVGSEAQATKANALAYGSGAISEGESAVAIGTGSKASAESAIAFGTNTKVESTGIKSVALGSNITKLSTAGSVVLGDASTEVLTKADGTIESGASHGVTAVKSVILPTKKGTSITYSGFAGQPADAGKYVSIGAVGAERQIKNVAPGAIDKKSTDAINGSQLYAISVEVANQETEIESSYFHTNDGTETQEVGDATTNKGLISSKAGATGRFSLTAGINSKALNEGTIAIGNETTAGFFREQLTQSPSGAGAIAIGKQAKAESEDTIAIGRNAKVELSETAPNVFGIPLKAIAIGAESKSRGKLNVALGYEATAGENHDHYNATAIGAKSQALGVNSVAVGHKSQALNQLTVAVGSTSIVKGSESVAVGSGAKAGKTTGDSHTVALGRYAEAFGKGSMSMGSYSQSTGKSSLAVGTWANSLGQSSASLGHRAVSFGNYSFAGAREALAFSDNTVAIGYKSGAAGTNSIAFGNDSVAGMSREKKAPLVKAQSDFMVAERKQIEAQAEYDADQSSLNKSKLDAANADLATKRATLESAKEAATNEVKENAIAIGNSASATNENTIAIGKGAEAKGTSSISIGTGNVVSGNNSGAIGDPNTISGDASYALGNDNTVANTKAFVLGNSVTTTADNSVYLGDSSAVNAGDSTGGSTGAVTNATVNKITYGNFAGTTAVGVVTVGSTGNERRIQNVAAGKISDTSTDAINGSQLYLTNNVIGNIADSLAGDGDILGGNAALTTTGNDAGKITMSDIGNTNKNNIHDAIIAAKTTVIAGKNISSVNEITKDDGSKQYTIDAIDTTAVVEIAPNQALSLSSTSATSNNKTVTTYTLGLNLDSETMEVNSAGKLTSKAVEKVKQDTSADNIAEVTPATGADTYGKAGTEYKVKVSKQAVKDAAKEAIDVKGTGAITVNTTNVNGVETHTVSYNGTEAAKTTPLSYKANGANLQTVNLSDGLNFTNGDKTVASVDANGVVKFDLNEAAKTQLAKEESVEAGQSGLVSVDSTGTNNTGGKKFVVDVTKGVFGPTTAGSLVAGNTAGVATVADVVSAVNAGYWIAKVNDGSPQNVKFGDSVNFVNGKGTTARKATNGITYDVSLSSTDSSITITNPTGDNGAVDIKLNTDKLPKAVVAEGKNTTVTSSTTGNTTTYTVNAVDKSASVSVSDALNMTKGAETPDGNTDITNYALDLSDTTKTNIQKGVDAKNTVDNQGITFTGDSGSTSAKKLGESLAVNGKTDEITVTASADKLEIGLADQVKTDIASKMTSFKVQANSTAAENVNNGETVKFIDGKNIEITQAGKEFTIKTKDVVTFTSVTTDTLTAGPVVINKDTGINAGGKQITGVASGGDTGTNAANIDDVKRLAATSVEKVKKADGTDNIATVTVADGKVFGDAGATYEVSVSKEAVKNAAKEAIDVKGTGAITVNTTNEGGVETHTVSYNGTEAAKTTPLSYKANGGTAQTVNLSDGLNFTNGDKTVASVDANGVVKFDLSDAAKTQLAKEESVEAGQSGLVSVDSTATNDTGGKKFVVDVTKGEFAEPTGGKLTETPTKTGVATVEDVAKAVNKGYWVAKSGTTTKNVKFGDTVTFVDGTATTASMTEAGEVKYDVKYDGNTITTTADGKLQVNTNALPKTKMAAGSNTEVVGDGTEANPFKVNVVTGVTKVEAGKAGAEAADKTKVATVGDIVNTINNVSWNVNSTAIDGGESTYTAGENSVKAGDTLNINAGKNIKITGTGKTLNVATKDDVTFTSVTTDTLTAGPVVINKDTGINAGGKQITGVASGGDTGTNAANIADVKRIAATSVEKVKKADGTDNIATVTVAAGKVFGDAGATYEVSVSKEAVKNAAKEAIDVKGTGAITVNTTNEGGVETHTVSYNGTEAAKTTPLSYKANGGTSKTVMLNQGLDFTNTTNITASIEPNGVVKHTLNSTLTGLTSAQFKDGNKETKVTSAGLTTTDGTNTTTISPTEIKVGDKEGNSDKPVTITSGTNGGTISNLETKLTDNTTSGSKPDGLTTTNAATVGDVLNAGWNLQGNGKAKDFVKPYDTVNFTNGTGTLVDVNTDADGKVSTIKVNVDSGKLTNNPDGSVKGVISAEKAKELVDNLDKAEKTLAALEALGDQVDQDVKDKAKAKIYDAEKAIEKAGLHKVATVQNVSEAINNSGFTLKTSANGGEKISGNDELINPADTIDMAAGKNLTVKQEANGKVTYATAENVNFTSVQFGDNGPKISADGNNIKVGDQNGAPVKITNVADGEAPTDAVNVGQLNRVIGGVNQQINRVDLGARAGIASAGAMANLPQVYLPGKSALSIAGAQYRGQAAYAIGYSRISDNGKWLIRASASSNTQKDMMVGAGVSYIW